MSEEFFKMCVNCKCCERHQKLKPRELKKFEEAKVNTQKVDRNCICPCRHNARFFCRNVTEPNEVFLQNLSQPYGPFK